MDEALVSFGKAIELEPGNGKANYHCARTHHAMGNVKDAVVRYREAIKVMPANAEARFHLGRALEVEFMSGNMRALQEGQAQFTEAVRLNPKDCEFRCCLARVLGAGGDHATAADQWAVAVKLAGPSDVELQRKQASAIEDAGNRDKALVVLRQVLLTPTPPPHCNGHYPNAQPQPCRRRRTIPGTSGRFEISPRCYMYRILPSI